MNSDDRLISFFIGLVLAYVAVEYIVERQKAFAEWQESFIAPFVKHPGRREWLRETLELEEFKDA